MTLRTAILLACCLGCNAGILGNRPLVDHNGGRGGGPVNTGNAGPGRQARRRRLDGRQQRRRRHRRQRRHGPGSAGTGGGGACAISCGPAACPVRDGQPRVLVTSPNDHQLIGLAVNADTLFWGTYPNQPQGEIRSMPLAGGPSTLLASNVIVGELYLDGSIGRCR